MKGLHANELILFCLKFLAATSRKHFYFLAYSTKAGAIAHIRPDQETLYWPVTMQC